LSVKATIEQENAVEALYWLFFQVSNFYLAVVIGSAVLSWLVAFDVVNLRNRFVSTIHDIGERLTTPALKPIRKVIPNLGGVDLSPVALIIGIQFLQFCVKNYLAH
jgi:YggT family protein